ncbi:2Fe-2S iron-sulfur cluster binding domain-containing protein, partial [Chamaesiphon polymorphus]
PPMSVTVLFMPERLTTTAQPGEPLLNVAERAGVAIPTGCLKGACFVCRVAIEGQDNPIRACIATVPSDELSIVHRYVVPS